MFKTKEIIEFLSYKRPEGSKGQRAFTARYLNFKGQNSWTDAAGNIFLDLRSDARHKTLFVAHTDTVHHTDGRQTIIHNKGKLTVDPRTSNCLGADDGAGVLMLLHLIRCRVPALYVFTVGEERGGIGAKFLVKDAPKLLAEFDRAVAFDRRGSSSVITHQGMGRCCSNDFADALSDQLSNDRLMFAPDSTGVYTDTAEFTDIIPECTNISIGYLNEHTARESLDLTHLFCLMEQAALVDWDGLPTSRNPDDAQAYDDWGMEDWNDYLYDALWCAIWDAESGYYDELLWLTAEVVSPDDPDTIYHRIQDIKPHTRALKDLKQSIDFLKGYESEQLACSLAQFYLDITEYHFSY